MGCKYSPFRVPSKREKCPPRVETAAGKRKKCQVTWPSLSFAGKNTRCLISLIAGKLETKKTQLRPPGQVFVNVSVVHTSRRIWKTLVSKKPTIRPFQTAWFERFKWLHHDERRDAACCHTCLKALQSGMLTSDTLVCSFRFAQTRRMKICG